MSSAVKTRCVRRVVGVEATGINACPCAQGLVRGRASERLLEAGFDEDDVERILRLVPLATHNQRARGTLLVGTEVPLNAETLADVVERSMSSPIYELLKRPDELFVVEHAHLQPRFVEDSVRAALRQALERYPALEADDFLSARQVNFETIHTHDVVAERFGTVGALRAELAGEASSGAHTELGAWLTWGNGGARANLTRTPVAPSPTHWIVRVEGRIVGQPVVVRNVPGRGAATVYVGTSAGRVYAFAPNYVRWQADFGQLGGRARSSTATA